MAVPCRRRIHSITTAIVAVADHAGGSDVAMQDAAPMPLPTPDAEMEQDPEQRRFNSTSSIFINSTITRPDIDEIILCVAP